MSELKNELEDEEAVAQDVVFPTANIEDDGQRGQVFDAAKAKEGLTRISSCVLPDHAYHQLYLNLVGKALIARGVSGWDLNKNGSLDREKRDESMNLGFTYLSEHFLWLKKFPVGTLPRRLIDEVSHDWVLEAFRRVEEGQLERYSLPESIREKILKVKNIVEGKTVNEEEAPAVENTTDAAQEEEIEGPDDDLHPPKQEEAVAGTAFMDRVERFLEQCLGCSCFGAQR
uniref:Uncharacterized protein n=2 Tax=Lotharella globosa TaxID=91324 RepID=A0A7S4DH53_9EUKA